MIRRGFWVAVGAAGGIMGYRRAVAAGRAVSGATAAWRGDPSRPPRPRARRVKRGMVRSAIRFGRDARDFTRDARDFTRDVREGMDLYIARHPGPEGPTLRAGTRTAGTRAGARAAGARADEKDDH